MILARTIKLTIVSENANEAFQFIKAENRNQNLALIKAYNHLHFENIAVEKLKHNDENYSRKKKELSLNKDKKWKLYQACQDEQKKSQLQEAYEKAKKTLYDFVRSRTKEARETYEKVVGFTQQNQLRNVIKDDFDLMSDTIDCITQITLKDYKNDVKSGLLQGKRSLRNYSKNHPLHVRGRALKFYEEKDNIYIRWIKGIIFKCVLPVKRRRDAEIKSTLNRILLGTYKVCDSSISTDDKLILNLSLRMPDKDKIEFVPGRIVGVDLGMAIPAYVSLNDVPYIKKGIGAYQEFARVRMQMQNRKRQLQKNLSATKGGKGRNHKRKALDHLKEKESNFARTYNHFVSSKIIKFALKHKAGQINLEKITSETLKDSVLKKWSYYQLQQMIEYKAEREGITVRYIDPNYTSQKCSFCGSDEKGQRINQETFICKKCGLQLNADYNASQNIAKSNRYM